MNGLTDERPTSNAQRSTSNERTKEKRRTVQKTNVQHPTPNVQHRMKGQNVKKQAYDLEERLLEYSVRIIKVLEQIPQTRTGNHITG